MRYVAGILFIVLFVLASLYTHFGGAVQEIGRGIGYQFIQDLPPLFDDRTFSVTPIKNGDGSIAQGIAEAVSGHSRYSEIERQDLDPVLAEQGFQHTDLVNPDTRVPPGNIASVDTIISGEVLDRQIWPLFYSLQVILKATDVKTGKVLFLKTYRVSYEFPRPMPLLYTGAAVLGFIFLSMLHGWISVSSYNKALTRSKKAKVDLLNLLAGVSRSCLGVEKSLRDDGFHDEAERLCALRRAVVNFRDDIVFAPWGGSDRKDYRKAASTFRKASSNMRKMDKILKKMGLPASSENELYLEHIVKAESLLAVIKN